MARIHNRLPFKESDLLKSYREADARARYLYDTDEKLVSYRQVLDLCANSKQCQKSRGVKKHQILFWTYLRIGDLFLQKNLDEYSKENLLNALKAYENALECAKGRNEQIEILTKIRDIYRHLEDKTAALDTTLQMAELVDDALKIEIFLNLADEATHKSEEAYFLEQALKYVTQEKIILLQKCEKTLIICAKLLEIYEKAGLKADMARIKSVETKTHEMMLS